MRVDGLLRRMLVPSAALALALFMSGAATAQNFNNVFGQIVRNAIEQQQQQAAPGNQQVAPSRTQVAAIQRRLNALGYNVGKPDGILGRGTSRAIAAWQRDQGHAPTGKLTASQFQALLSAPAPAAAPVAPADAPISTGSGMRLLYDTDLPQNDYRSGMDDPALRGKGLAQCIAQCEADGLCQAFTFNDKANVCFLKTRAATPESFNGAVSGIKGDAAFSAPGDTIAYDPELARSLDSNELAALQQALNDAGYDAGPADGEMGGRTRAAIASFLEDNPGAGSGRADVGLLLAVTGQAGPQRGFDADAYAAPDLARRLSLLLLSRDPALLDSDAAVLRWLSEDADDRLGDARDRLAAYRKANDIEGPRQLAAIRAELLAEASAYAAAAADEAYRLKVSDDTRLGTYSPEAGMPIEEPYGFFRDRTLGYALSRLNIRLVGLVPDLPEAYSIPVDSADAASALLDQAAQAYERRVNLVAFLTLSDIGTDAAVVGAGAADPGDMPVTVRLDRLELQTARGYQRPGGERLALLVDTVGPAASGPADPVAMARIFGLQLLDGHIALAADQNTARAQSDILGGSYDSRYVQYFNFAVLGLHPDMARSPDNYDEMVDLMTPMQRLRAFGARDGGFGRFANEFERRRAITTFEEQIIPELLARAPAFPIPVVSIKQVNLGDYDFAAGAFPLSYEDGGRAILVPSSYGGMQPQEELSGLPRTLPMPESEAEQFVLAAGRSGRPTLFIMVFGTLLADRIDSGYAIRFAPTRAELHRDPSLQNKLADLDASAIVRLPEADVQSSRPINVRGTDQRWVERYQIPVLAGRPLLVPRGTPGRDGLEAIAALFALSAQPALLEQRDLTMRFGHILGLELFGYVNAAAREQIERGQFYPDYQYWAGADEFEREDSRKRFVAEMQSTIASLLPSLPLEISVLRYAGVEEYDLGRGTFPIALSSDSLTSSGSSGQVAIAELSGAIPGYPQLDMPEAEARDFRERLRTLVQPGLDPTVFGDAGSNIEAGTLTLLETYRLDRVSMEGGSNRDIVLHVSPLSRTLHAAADLATTLAAFPVPQAVAEQEPVAPVSVESGEAALVPASRFDLLGVTLGMTVPEARTVLQERLAGRDARPVSWNYPSDSPFCSATAAKLNAELAAATSAEHDRIRESFLDDFARDSCRRPELTVLDFAFGYEVAQERGGVDRILVFKSPQADGVVGAVLRAVPQEMAEALSNGLVEKYGADFTPGASSSDRFWPDDATRAELLRTERDCGPYLGDQSFPTEYYALDCGAFIRQSNTSVLMVDTRHLNHYAREITDRISRAAAAAPKPVLDF